MTRAVKSEDRKARLAEALRANLKRRKAQTQRRAGNGATDDTAKDPEQDLENAPDLAVNPPQTDPKGGRKTP